MKKLQQSKKKLQQGFTLIELMIVVAVIGVLAAIALPQYQNYVKKSQLGAALSTVAALKVNVEDYIATNGAFPSVQSDAMGTELGASSTSLGSLYTSGLAATSGASGSIVMILNSTSQFDSKKLAVSKDDSGKWSCITDIPATEKNVFPKGCDNGSIPASQ